MKKLLFTILITFIFCGLIAQGPGVDQYYILNPYLMNPAFAGYSKQTEIRATFAKQWIGIAEAPATHTISAHSALGKGLGLGGFLYYDQNGLNKETGVDLSVSYHIDLGENNDILKIRKLCFGVAATGYQHMVDLNKLTDHSYDPAVDGAENSAFGMDFNVGSVLRYDGFFAGISARGLGAKTLEMYDDATEPAIPTKLFIQLGYLFSPAENFFLDPSAVYKFNTDKQKQLDVNIKGIYYQESSIQYWLNMSLRRNMDKGNAQFLDLTGLAGIRYNGLLFAYAYNFGMSELKSSHSGSHQIMLGLVIRKAQKHEINCPIF